MEKNETERSDLTEEQQLAQSKRKVERNTSTILEMDDEGQPKVLRVTIPVAAPEKGGVIADTLGKMATGIKHGGKALFVEMVVTLE